MDAAPAKLEITSSVLSNPNDWAEEGYLIPHEPIRMGLRRAQEALNAGALQHRWKIEVFYQWWDHFAHLVHTHHDVEEKVVFPMINKRAAVPQKCTTDHKGLMDGFDTITKFHDKLKSVDDASLPAVSAEVTQFFTTWVKDMEAHLAEEERDIVPIMRQHFTKEEQDQMVQDILKFVGIAGSAKELPWLTESMIRWRGQKETELWKSNNLPLPVQLLHDYSWKDTHDENYTQKLNLLFQNAPPPPKEEICQIQ